MFDKLLEKCLEEKTISYSTSRGLIEWLTPSGELIFVEGDDHLTDAHRILKKRGYKVPKDPDWDEDLETFGRETGYIRVIERPSSEWYNEINIHVVGPKVTRAQWTTINKMVRSHGGAPEFYWGIGTQSGLGLKKLEKELIKRRMLENV